jgi:hypothetical protein
VDLWLKCRLGGHHRGRAWRGQRGAEVQPRPENTNVRLDGAAMPKYRSYKIVRETDVTNADQYRLAQAEELLREDGYVPHADGTWHRGRWALERP